MFSLYALQALTAGSQPPQPRTFYIFACLCPAGEEPRCLCEGLCWMRSLLSEEKRYTQLLS